MACQRFTSPGRNYVGTNLRVVAAPSNCVQQFGFGSMVIADCWEQGSQGPEAGGGWCFRSSDAYQITDLSPSQCVKCQPSIPTNVQYDCLNGGCVPKTTYNTPGFYANLAACQSGCAKNSNCKGECVEAAELAQLQQAVGNIKNRICG